MRRFANSTHVPIDRSLGEIRKTILRYGGDQFLTGEDTKSNRAFIGFRIRGTSVKIYLPLPDKSTFYKTEKGRARRNESLVQQAYEQASRQSWRALNLVIKAKLEAVEAGITSIEQEFLANLLLRDGQRTLLEGIGKDLPQVMGEGHLLLSFKGDNHE